MKISDAASSITIMSKGEWEYAEIKLPYGLLRTWPRQSSVRVLVKTCFGRQQASVDCGI